jgi:hypothetical protein
MVITHTLDFGKTKLHILDPQSSLLLALDRLPTEQIPPSFEIYCHIFGIEREEPEAESAPQGQTESRAEKTPQEENSASTKETPSTPEPSTTSPNPNEDEDASWV